MSDAEMDAHTIRCVCVFCVYVCVFCVGAGASLSDAEMDTHTIRCVCMNVCVCVLLCEGKNYSDKKWCRYSTRAHTRTHTH
jgi:hypothetical protein